MGGSYRSDVSNKSWRSGLATASSLGVSIFEATEALRFSATATEADLYVHTTYVLMQNHEGWRIAHVHSSQAAEERVAASIASVTHSLH